MALYDAVCPACGKVNRGLDLKETDGWMECEACRSVTRTPVFAETLRISASSAGKLSAASRGSQNRKAEQTYVYRIIR